MRGLVFILPLTLVACGLVLSPTREEPSATRELRRLLDAPAERVRDAVKAALVRGGFRVEEVHNGAHHLRTRPRRYSLTRANAPRLREIADLDSARRRGLRQIAEYWIRYEVSVERSGGSATVVAIKSHIQVVDRSQGPYLGIGVVQTIPQYYEVPSRGVLEGELFTAVGSDLYSAEEMLFRTGVMGRD